MTGVHLPDRLDVYRNGGGGLTLLGANLPGYVEMMTAGARSALRAISSNPVAKLWLGEEAKSLLREGMLVYWKERREWWTVQGKPTLFTQFPGGHVEALIVANLPDGLFEAALPALPLSKRFESAETMTGARLDVATTADFSEVILSASSVLNAAGWLYSNGLQWMRLPAGGLPPFSTQRVAFVPSSELPGGTYFIRWTPFYGTLAGEGVVGVVQSSSVRVLKTPDVEWEFGSPGNRRGIENTRQSNGNPGVENTRSQSNGNSGVENTRQSNGRPPDARNISVIASRPRRRADSRRLPSGVGSARRQPLAAWVQPAVN